jgi:peptidylprolyl isomerase
MPITRRSAVIVLTAAALAGGIAACGDEETKPSAAERTIAVEPPPPADTQGAPTETSGNEPAGPIPVVSKDVSKKPKIPTPKGSPPSKLVIKDIVKGKGATLKEGQTATAHYVGVSWSTGQEFDASWDRGGPSPFPIAQGSVIQGWVDGLQGMKIGGRRELVIPPALGYGPQGSPPSIAPNETLVFVVDLKKIS